MNVLFSLIKRNTKLFFKDKGMFFTSLITPCILLVLYATFLGKVYRDSFLMGLPEGVELAEKLLNGAVGGQLISSILAVSCVTVAFCSNMLMVQDKANGSIKDFTVSPVKKTDLSLSYYFSTLISTLLICYTATAVCLVYVGVTGWYLSIIDIVVLLLDVFLLVLFGTALSSIINFFLSSQGQISAVGSIISSGYGFICGAYMPISQFPEALQKVISFLPGTYGTSIIRNVSLRGVFAEMKEEGVPDFVITQMKDAIDCNLYFFDNQVKLGQMYTVLVCATVVLIGVYIAMNVLSRKKGQ
ncbi:MAG: ABC transporter permease [Clostridia bacterium]|nr:ABC transporter permease [Clostridia bacterium]